MSHSSLTTNQIRRSLKHHDQRALTNSSLPGEVLATPPQLAAVLILFLRIENAWELLFIRRSYHPNDPHSGQVAFPGGRRNPGDRNSTITALREAAEEIGLTPSDVEILGSLPPNRTITNYLVTPIVGTLPWPYPVQPQPKEVDRIFTIPLIWLADPANRFTKVRSLDPNNTHQLSVDYFTSYSNEVLWGASARITINLL